MTRICSLMVVLVVLGLGAGCHDDHPPLTLKAGSLSGEIVQTSRDPDGTVRLLYQIERLDDRHLSLTSPLPLTFFFWDDSTRVIDAGHPDHVIRVALDSDFAARRIRVTSWLLRAPTPPVRATAVSVALAGTGVVSRRMALP